MGKIISLKKLEKLLITHYSLLISVLITGCFDILHQAHKDFLKAAKKQGDVLMVGLESDKRVRELKGEKRPVNSWKKRAAVLSRLSEVDFVFPLPKFFDDKQSHLKLLQLIKPSVLAVSENTPFLEKKKKMIKKIGRKLFIFPFNPKYSTTKLIEGLTK
jgi:rfaE bifunctional protein nucleotidyltransferase chain/domain